LKDEKAKLKQGSFAVLALKRKWDSFLSRFAAVWRAFLS
jgi:hypothetical protein